MDIDAITTVMRGVLVGTSIVLQVVSGVVALLGLTALVKNDEVPQLLFGLGVLLFAIFLLLAGIALR